MMKLPTFTNENPSAEWLRAEQTRLQIQTDVVLETTGLRDVFAGFGELLPIGGSYAYGLMVYPDIDLGVVAPAFTREDVATLLGMLGSNQYVRKINWLDTVHFPARRRGHPCGYWFGLEVPLKDDDWGVDCWVLPGDFDSKDDDARAQQLVSLGQADKDIILRIKYDLIREGQYGSAIQSVDVYEAVLSGNVTDTDSFKRWHTAQN